MYRINIFDNIDIGPGQWVLNIKLPSDKEFRKTLETEWMEFRKLKKNLEVQKIGVMLQKTMSGLLQ